MRSAFLVVLFLGIVGCNSKHDEIAGKSSIGVLDSNVIPQTADSALFKTVAVKVTGMMCPHGCYPQVKSLIVKTNHVESIELTPQLKKDVIDNPVVLVKVRGELDKAATTKAILEAGFEQVEFTEL